MNLKDNLPYELSGIEIQKIAEALTNFWGKINEIETIIKDQNNALTCADILLPIHAQSVGIEKFPEETNKTLRIRIANSAKFNFLSGTIKGLSEIFKVYGIEGVNFVERKRVEDWATITMELSDVTLQRFARLIPRLCNAYGAVCRHFFLDVTYNNYVHVGNGYQDFQFSTYD